jgi:nitrogen fixation protein NifU and related proteins
MPDLRGLYQEVILDHSKKPRNYRVLEGADHHAEGYNPLCGDRITIYIKLDNDRITDLSFQGSGCAISTSSASLLTETLKGKTLDEADALFKKFHALVMGEANGNQAGDPQLGKLAVFSGVAEFPVRVKCATLAWHTLRSALKGEEKTVTTE